MIYQFKVTKRGNPAILICINGNWKPYSLTYPLGLAALIRQNFCYIDPTLTLREVFVTWGTEIRDDFI